MHIENANFHIHVGSGALAAAALAALAGTEPSKAAPAAAQPVAIGQPWSGIDGVFAGISRGENGEPDAPLILLDAKPDRDMTYEEAVEWAKSLGNGARLPTRFESALLYANLQDQFDKDRVHWIGEQYSDAFAWYQYFTSGYQGWLHKGLKLQARAVRRLNPSVL